MTKTIKTIITIQKIPLKKYVSYPVKPHCPKSSLIQSGYFSTFKSFICSLTLWMLVWMDSECEEMLRQHMPSKSWQPCPWASSRKCMAALSCSVACLVASVSLRRSLSAVKVAFACLPSQLCRWGSSLRALAAANWGQKNETVTLFALFQL